LSIVGAVAALYQAAIKCGITNALGNTPEDRLSLALIIGRLINQGSRLSCLELAKNHAIREIVGQSAFTEGQLYHAMDWLNEQQGSIEKKLFAEKSSGDPISIEVFPGNTRDPLTVKNYIEKLQAKFGCSNITMVALVEHAFRTCKTDWLEAQPVFVRKESRTRAHLFIIMLAYKIAMFLEQSWREIGVSAKNGVEKLCTISSFVCKIGQEKIAKVPKPNAECKELLDKLNVVLPTFLPIIT